MFENGLNIGELTEQKTALGLTKLALGCVENPTVDDVFERSAAFIGEVCQSPFAEE